MQCWWHTGCDQTGGLLQYGRAYFLSILARNRWKPPDSPWGMGKLYSHLVGHGVRGLAILSHAGRQACLSTSGAGKKNPARDIHTFQLSYTHTMDVQMAGSSVTGLHWAGNTRIPWWPFAPLPGHLMMRWAWPEAGGGGSCALWMTSLLCGKWPLYQFPLYRGNGPYMQTGNQITPTHSTLKTKIHKI